MSLDTIVLLIAGGAVAGFAKAYKRERPEALVKVVDFGLARLAQDEGLTRTGTILGTFLGSYIIGAINADEAKVAPR